MVPVWLFATVLIWAVVVSYFWLVRNPFPFPDRGHRCFAVPGENAAKTVVSILQRFGGLSENFTFDPGPTHQTILSDNQTVIIWHDQIIQKKGLAGNAISVVVSDPRMSAEKAGYMLRRAGYTANIVYDLMPESGDKFVLLSSDAFAGWVLAFRLHAIKMGKPVQRKLLK